ncbi:unnamed protein product [Linum tenue]|uniref:Uncharacterized protein n=1 Tax=Linum tenue TaxID=586396 RepID=A0AAV0N041_9ROSI|nr:unnamed protein product [Linum tenue]CAI0504268.1 unnamed protein product [Linum tenue]
MAGPATSEVSSVCLHGQLLVLSSNTGGGNRGRFEPERGSVPVGGSWRGDETAEGLGRRQGTHGAMV